MLTKMEQPIYLDAAATTPVHPEVLEAMLPYFSKHFGNSNSPHDLGKQAKDAIQTATCQVANALNVNENEVFFTSGATEAINMGIIGFWESNAHLGRHFITSKTEHKAVLRAHEFLESVGCEVTYLPTDSSGMINLSALEDAITNETLLVSLMHVNNETGLIHDIQEIAQICLENQCAFFSDCTQAIGKINTDYSHPGLSLLCISAHKFGGPKGVGALIKKQGVDLRARFYGGDNQNLRPGTLNTPGIVGLGMACTLLKPNTSSNWIPEKVSAFFNRNGIVELQFNPSVNGIKVFITPEFFDDWIELARLVNYSTGSACTTGLMQPSHVYSHLNLPKKRIIRLSKC